MQAHFNLLGGFLVRQAGPREDPLKIGDWRVASAARSFNRASLSLVSFFGGLAAAILPSLLRSASAKARDAGCAAGRATSGRVNSKGARSSLQRAVRMKRACRVPSLMSRSSSDPLAFRAG
jgi:hypothetical protein